MGLDTTNYYLRDALFEMGLAYSRGQASRLIVQGVVLVNDRVEVDMDRVICGYDVVTLKTKRRPKPKPEIPDTTKEPDIVTQLMGMFGMKP